MTVLNHVIFVTGYSRSGTTLICDIIGTSSDVCSLKETHFFENLIDFKDFPRQIAQDRAVFVLRQYYLRSIYGLVGTHLAVSEDQERATEFANGILSESSVFTGAELYTKAVAALAKLHEKEVICEQTGKFLFFASSVADSLPRLSIVFMVRNPYRVLSSEAYKHRSKRLGVDELPVREVLRTYFNYNPILVSITIQSHFRAYKRFLSSNSGRAVILKFEDLTSPDFDFSSLEQQLEIGPVNLADIRHWGSSMHSSKTEAVFGINPIVNQQPRVGGFRDRAGRIWVRALMKGYCKDFGYSHEVQWCDPILGLFWLFILPLQLALLVVMNASRMPNMLAAARRRLLGY